MLAKSISILSTKIPLTAKKQRGKNPDASLVGLNNQSAASPFFQPP